MAEKVRVFVSSTFDEHSFDREYIEMLCRRLNVAPQLFPEHSTAGRSREYLDALARSQIMLLLVPNRPSSAVQEEIEHARRHGVPIIPFYKVHPGAATDYKSVAKRTKQYRLEHSAEHACIYNQLSTLEAGVINGISAILASRMNSSLVLKEWTADVYEQGDQAILLAGTRLAVAQSTSSFILGPRAGRYQEHNFYNHCMNLVDEALSGRRHIRLLYVFDEARTRQEVIDAGLMDYPARVQAIERIEALLPALASNKTVRLIPLRTKVTPSIVSDDRFTVATVFGEHWYYMWLSDSRAGANELWRILESLPSDHDLETFVRDVKTLL